MDTNVFREFVELTMQGSYTSAARALNLSQPTLSRHVGALERELDAQLVADVLPVRLTTAGDLVFQAALHMNDLLTQLHNDLSDLRQSGQTRIRVHDTFTLKTLSPRIVQAANQITREFPYAGFDYLSLRPGVSPEQAVADSECDLSFVRLVGTQTPSALPKNASATALPQASGRLAFGMPKSEPLSNLAEVRLSDLEHKTFLFPALKSCEPFKDSFLAACHERGFRAAVKLVPCRLPEEFYLFDHGSGMYVLSESDLEANVSLAQDLAQRVSIVPSAVGDNLNAHWFALHRTAVDDDALARFIELLAEE